MWRLIPIALPVVIGLILFNSTGRDDSHITYWPAYTLARFGEMINYNGARVEQSSSLTMVLLLAAFAAIWPSALAAIAPIVSVVSGLATVYLTQRLADRVDSRLVLAAGLFAASAVGLVYWAWSGMETTLASALGAALVLACVSFSEGATVRRVVVVMVAMTLYVMVRPENVAVAPAAMVGALVVAALRARSDSSVSLSATVRRLLVLLGLSVGIAVAIVGLRLAYFGIAFPQPVFAKAAGLSLQSLTGGLSYLASNAILSSIGPLFVLGILGFACCLYDALRSRLAVERLLPAMFGLASIAFIAFSGGDWMEGGRFLVPATPFAAFGAVVGLQRVSSPRKFVFASGVIVALQLAGNVHMAATTSKGASAPTVLRYAKDPNYGSYSWFERVSDIHRRDIVLTEHVRDWVDRIAKIKPGVVSVLSGQMGLVAYHLSLTHFGRVRLIDRFALATQDFTSCAYGRELPHTSFGLRMPLARFFADRETIRRVCGIGDPDLIFDVSPPDVSLPDLLEQNGYSVVFQGEAEVLAVRADLRRMVATSDHVSSESARSFRAVQSAMLRYAPGQLVP
jgi:hypothetical protein